MLTASQVIVDFLKRQPESIRDSMLAPFAILANVNWLEASTEEFHLLAYSFLERPAGLPQVFGASAAIGILDYYFSKPRIDPSDVAYIAEAKDSDALRNVARTMPLKNAFGERAEKEWRALRKDTLSFEALRNQEFDRS